MRLRAEIPLLLLAAMTLPAQNLVEYSITTAGAAGAAAGMSSLGKAAAGIMQNANGTLEVAHQSAAAGTAKAKSTAPAGRSENTILLLDTAPSAVKLSPPPDPASVRIGMTAQEALAKFGPPGMKLSSADGSHLVETWSYGSDPNTVTLTLRDGKVAEVSSPSREKAENEQAVVVIVP
ncbi:MAG: hypothetical protein ACLQGV_13995 [Bryobacteraceae bacterium]